MIYIVVIIACVVISPLALVWSLNTLFALGIPYTFWTWLAMLVLGGTIGGVSRSK
jgi:hypothetical protein